ncbi:uncharacterized protein LOC144142640 [Haemaphysalis longicornis]
MCQELTTVNEWPVQPMEEESATLELLALQSQPAEEEEEVGATLPAGTLVHIDGDTLVAVVEEGQTITAGEVAPQLAELDLSSLLSVEEPEEDVLQKALLQAGTVVTEESTQEEEEEQPQPEPETQPEPQPEPQPPQTVVIDVSSPIELCQNALIVVNGKKCVLQQDPGTGQVLAYPIQEQPKRKRGRPRKVRPPPEEESEPPPASTGGEQGLPGGEEEEPEDDGDTGMVDVVTEDGALVRRSCRRRKVVRTMQDYHLSEGSESEPEPEPQPEEPRRRGRPPKNFHEEDPFWKRNPGRRRGRPRKRDGSATKSSNPMQAFLVQMADGQTLMMQIPAASIPTGMDLHLVAQNIANSLNAAAAQQALGEAGLSMEDGAAPSVLVAMQTPNTEQAELLPQPPTPQPTPPPTPLPAKRRPGRPRKRPLTPPPPPTPEVVGEPPLGDTPMDDTPVCEAPMDGAPVDDTPVGNTPVDDTPTDGGSQEDAAMPDDDATPAVASTVLAQSLEDAVAQVLGPIVSLAVDEEGQECGTTTVQPMQEVVGATAIEATEDATVIPVPEKLVSLLLPKLGSSPEEQEQLQCSGCEFQAAYAQQLQEHLHEVHTSELVRCRRCPHVCLSQEALIAHYRAQHPRCVCPYCDHIAEQAYAIRRHMARHTQPGASTCPVCHKRYKDPYILKMHLKMVHMPVEVLFECATCSKKFTRKAHLKRHARTHNPNKPLKCPLCEYRGCERSDITKHMLIHEEPKHVCPICNRSFRHIKNKELHLKRHKGQKDYKCGVCDFYGYTFTDIRKHIERRHADPHTILCDRCGQAFKSQALLKEHQLSAQCEVYLIEQELTEYEETAPENLLPTVEEQEESADVTLEETLVDANGQLLELPGHQYTVMTTSTGEVTIAEVSEEAQETDITMVQDTGEELIV